MAPAALSCHGLVKRYGDVVAVDGLDLEVAAGECFGLLGPNGAGKTTTVEILEGLIGADAGRIEVLGEPVAAGDHRVLRERLGIQLQETKFPDKLAVLEVITLFRSFYARGIAPAEALAAVELEEKAKSWVRHLSGGQKQRLSLACALVGDPEVLFLDEPTTGLDPQSRRKTWEVIERFKARGRTVLLTTHYMEEAARLCDRVAIIDHGKVIAEGSPGALVASLGAEHVLEFEADSEVPIEILRTLAGAQSATAEEGVYRVTVRSLAESVPALLAELRARDAILSRLATHQATLEDVFVAMTGRHLRNE